MQGKSSLRPVVVVQQDERIEGYFHRFTYFYAGYQSETKALIELKDGRLRYFDPYFVQFMDRQVEKCANER